MERTESFGENAVGVSFNPSGSNRVDRLKTKFAEIIDELHSYREASDNPDQKRLASVAITEAEGACMWAVKAATKGL